MTKALDKNEYEKSLQALQDRLGYHFKDETLLRLALTHHSAENAHTVDKNNERLEFLGDAVLYLTVGESVYLDFPRAAVGQLSEARVSAVRGSNLTAWGRKLDLGQLLRCAAKPSAAMIEDAFEALIGAMYLDCGRQREPIRRLLTRFSNYPSPQHQNALTNDMTEDAVAARAHMLIGPVPPRLLRYLDDERSTLASKMQTLLADEAKRRKGSRKLSVKCAPGLGSSSRVYFAKLYLGADLVTSTSASTPQDARFFALIRAADIWNCWNPLLSALGILNVTGSALAAKTLSLELLNNAAATRGEPKLRFDTSFSKKRIGPPRIKLAAHTNGELAIRLEGFDGRLVTQAAVLTLLWRLAQKKPLLPERQSGPAVSPSTRDEQSAPPPAKRVFALLHRALWALAQRFRLTALIPQAPEELKIAPPDAPSAVPQQPICPTQPERSATAPAPHTQPKPRAHLTPPPDQFSLPLGEIIDGSLFAERSGTGKKE